VSFPFTLHVSQIIKKEFIGVIYYFLSFLTRYDERKVHNMLALMLDPGFKILKLISYFIGYEHGGGHS
jgi:hypothetical protein